MSDTGHYPDANFSSQLDAGIPEWWTSAYGEFWTSNGGKAFDGEVRDNHRGNHDIVFGVSGTDDVYEVQTKFGPPWKSASIGNLARLKLMAKYRPAKAPEATAQTEKDKLISKFGQEFIDRVEETVTQPDSRFWTDLEYIMRRLDEVHDERQSEIWMWSYNSALGTRPIDELGIKGAAGVIAAVDAETDFTY